MSAPRFTSEERDELRERALRVQSHMIPTVPAVPSDPQYFSFRSTNDYFSSN